ncbi:unnamed protein product [Phaedon cochleariae]|uniref:Uncharacterized protein n=1 Tax=Phaedon cochleariae TaxID=80249 RepID=A0A9P0DE68_PHACE|nr:unnamed protein product [Phaedon cochleariae]
MLNIIVFVFCIGVLIPQYCGADGIPILTRERLNKIRKECQANPATHIDDAELSRFGNGEEVDHSTLGPFLLCLNVGLGLQEPNGDFSSRFREIMSRKIAEDRMDDFMKTCGKKASDNAEEAAISLSRCINTFDTPHNPFEIS